MLPSHGEPIAFINTRANMSVSVSESEMAAVAGAAEAPRTLTKAELAETLFERVGLNKREAKDMVDAFFDEIRLALEQGDPVKLSGFGNFQVRDKPQRPGRNPKTGEVIPISARRVVTFHASQKLKQLVEKPPSANPDAEGSAVTELHNLDDRESMLG